MASAKDLKKRISTVRNTQQTTKAMKMVSAAKLRRAQEAIWAHRPYARRIDRLIRRLCKISEVGIATPLIANGDNGVSGRREGKNGSVILVVVASDRGLCGSFNSSILKTAHRWMKENRANYREIRMALVGRKAVEFFRSRGFKNSDYSAEFGRRVSFIQARALNQWLINEFTGGRCTEVKLIYNEFKNAISQKVVVENFLPLTGGIEAADTHEAEKPISADLYLVKPSVPELFEELLKRHFAIQIYRILLESQASEHGARMSAMESATNNAGEMIRQLTLKYNKERQAGITREMLEIISGSESQKG